MSYYVGDDSAITYPVSSQATPAQPIEFDPVVRAVKSDETTVAVTGAVWADGVSTSRNLRIPLGTLAAGLWSLRLVIDDEADLFLGNVYIE